MFEPCTTLGDGELVDEIRRLERQVSALHADQARLIAELSRRRVAAWEDDVAQAEAAGMSMDVRRGLKGAFDDGSAEVGLALALATGTARARVEAAVAMCTTMPDTLAALESGRLDRSRAEHLAGLTSALRPRVRREVEAEVLSLLYDERVVLTRSKLGNRVRDAIARCDAASVAAAQAARAAARRVWIEPLPDAMARLCVEGPAAQVQALYTAVDALARTEQASHTKTTGGQPGSNGSLGSAAPTAAGRHAPTGAGRQGAGEGADHAGREDREDREDLAGLGMGVDPHTQPITERFEQRAAAKAAREQAAFADPGRPVDTRSIGARRFDALVAMAADVLSDPEHRLGTMQGQRPHIQVTVAATTLAGADDDPGRLTGYGAVPADVARRLAAVGVWRRLLTDPASGVVTEYGRRTYRPPAALRDLILATHTTCIQPSCGQPSRTSQIDHLTAYAIGGTTGEANAGPECGPHHLIKTHRPHWAVERLPDGTMAWTSPTGHTYLRPPDPVGPVTRIAVSPVGPSDRAGAGDPARVDALTGVHLTRLGLPDTHLSATEYAAIRSDLDAAEHGLAMATAADASRAGPPPF